MISKILYLKYKNVLLFHFILNSTTTVDVEKEILIK